MDKKDLRPARPRPGLFAASGFYLLAALGLWAVGALAPHFSGGSYEWNNLIVSLIYYGLFMILPVVLWGLRHDHPADALRLNPIPFGTVLTAVFAATLCVWINYDFSVLWSALWQKLGLNVFADVYVRPANTAELTVSVLNASLITVVGEELVFRGAIFSAWERRGSKRAVWVTAVLFALLHGSPLGLPGQLLGGFVLALIVLWTDSLYSGMIFHAVYNAALVMLNYIGSAPAASEAESEAALLMQTNIIGALGGISAMVSLVFEIGVYSLMLFFVLRSLRRRAKWWGIEIQPEAPVPMFRSETLTLMLAAVCVAMLFAGNIMMMLGG